jgi:hypothetical protein
MAPPYSGASSSGPSTAAATKLRDEALAAAKTLEEEAASLESTDTKHSKQLMEEAALLKSAVAAQERVRAAAAALELERAQADTLELKAVTLRDRLRSPNPGDATSLDDDHSFSDAAAVARLHNQAAAVQNIRNLVSLVLDLQSSDYSKWRGHISSSLAASRCRTMFSATPPTPTTRHGHVWITWSCRGSSTPSPLTSWM